jgi:transcriptional regulator with XRE-family HTH domain
MSQLDLATLAGTTPRHLSFLETGRSRPGAELVLRLASAFDVPIRERNALLLAAGLSPAYPAFALEDEAMGPVRNVLDRILRTHEPYPAWVGSRGFRFISSNRAAEALFPGMCALSPEAIVDLWFGPGPFRDIVENWQDVVWAGIASLRREVVRASDPSLAALLRRAERHATSIPEPDPDTRPELPVVCPRLNIGGQRVRTISTVMRFDTAVEVTVSELRVELMFPADDESEAFFRGLAASGDRPDS